jgi:hypothetical protein
MSEDTAVVVVER